MLPVVLTSTNDPRSEVNNKRISPSCFQINHVAFRLTASCNFIDEILTASRASENTETHPSSSSSSRPSLLRWCNSAGTNLTFIYLTVLADAWCYDPRALQALSPCFPLLSFFSLRFAFMFSFLFFPIFSFTFLLPNLGKLVCHDAVCYLFFMLGSEL